MRRVIVDYEKLTDDILDLIVVKYPFGYDYNDIISFKNSSGQTINAIEVRTDNTIYLVKISRKMEEKIDDYIEEENFLDESDFNNEEFENE